MTEMCLIWLQPTSLANAHHYLGLCRRLCSQSTGLLLPVNQSFTPSQPVCYSQSTSFYSQSTSLVFPVYQSFTPSQPVCYSQSTSFYSQSTSLLLPTSLLLSVNQSFGPSQPIFYSQSTSLLLPVNQSLDSQSTNLRLPVNRSSSPSQPVFYSRSTSLLLPVSQSCTPSLSPRCYVLDCEENMVAISADTISLERAGTMALGSVVTSHTQRVH